MVVWVFAGGGEAEVRGLIPFFEQNFPEIKFERKSPIRRKPGPRPGLKKQYSYGLTGKSFYKDIPKKMDEAFKANEKCHGILILDDLDCRDYKKQKELINNIIQSIGDNLNTIIGFAAPELETWVIADWDHTIAKHPDFKERHNAMRHWLISQKNIPFRNPESFGKYDSLRDTCDEKMSDLIIQSSTYEQYNFLKIKYSKARHTPELLLDARPEEIVKKCPIFKKFYYELNHFQNLMRHK
jgi:hypothetical protein